jgi:hypothetical protein
MFGHGRRHMSGRSVGAGEFVEALWRERLFT